MVRYFLVLISTFLFIYNASAQDRSRSSIMYRLHNSTLNPEEGALAFNNVNHLNISSRTFCEHTGGGEGAGYSRRRTYTDLKHERNGGIALTVVGSIMTAAGVSLIALGAPRLRSSLSSGYGDFVPAFYETYFGVGSLVAGTGMTIGGLIMWVKKERRLDKYRASHPEESF